MENGQELSVEESRGSDKQCVLKQKGLEKLKKALASDFHEEDPSNQKVADAYGIDRETVGKIRNGNAQTPVTRNSIEKLFDPLNLDLDQEDYQQLPRSPKTARQEKGKAPNPFRDVGAIPGKKVIRPQLTDRTSLKDTHQSVRSQASTKVLNLFSQIQLLNKRQVAVDQLYVDVYMLEVSEFQGTILGLLEGQDAREQFDRFGLGKRGERSPGLAIAASEDFPRLMVLGKPGSGKSTFLRHLAVSCAKGKFLGDYIPVLLELRDVDEAAFSLFQYLHEEFGLEQEAQTKQILKQGRVLLLLDGLDEVPSSLRQTVQNELRKFVKRYDQNRFILTCRTQTTEYIPGQFYAVEVADFKTEQVECFALHWFTAMAGTSEQGMVLKNQFMEKLRESPQTAELAVTPVLLSLTCWIFNDMKCLPQKRSHLYRDGLNLLLQQWDEGRGINRDSGCDRYQQLITEERKQLLSYVAVRKFEQAENFVLFEETELCDYIAEHLQLSAVESREMLQAIAQQHGLLIERAQGIWSFSHLTFQEYLVAEWFCDRNHWQDLANHVIEKHWREVFLLAAERLNDSCELLLLMKEKIDSLLVNDAQLQKFLNWISKKAVSTSSNYSPSEVRAFYFNFQITHFGTVNLDYFQIHIQLLGLDDNLRQSLEKITQLNLNQIHRRKFRESRIQSVQRIINTDLYLDYALINLICCGQAYIAREINNINVFDHPLRLEALDRGFFMYFNRILEIGLQDDFMVALEQLRIELPQVETSEENRKWYIRKTEDYRYWWENSSENWFVRLREISIKYRNIDSDWHFSNLQSQILKRYYDANKLLVDCIKYSQELSTSEHRVIEEIQEILFLPIAEIRKQKN